MLKEMYCLFVITLAFINQISIVDGETTAKCIANGKRMMQMKTRMASAKPGYWTRLNDGDPICFFSRYESPGIFSSPYEGYVGSFKLEHIYGKVTCDKVHEHYRSNWGCNRDTRNPLSVFITDDNRKILFNRTGNDPHGNVKTTWYSSDLFNGHSKELVFNRMDDPLYVNPDLKLRVWYGEDLMNSEEFNNDDRSSCVDVYAHFV